jgi:hypothetical protein
MRFAFGAGFAARTVTRAVEKVLVRRPSSAGVSLANSEKRIGMTD